MQQIDPTETIGSFVYGEGRQERDLGWIDLSTSSSDVPGIGPEEKPLVKGGCFYNRDSSTKEQALSNPILPPVGLRASKDLTALHCKLRTRIKLLISGSAARNVLYR